MAGGAKWVIMLFNAAPIPGKFKMEIIPCNLCGSDQTKILYSLPDYLLDRPWVQSTLVQCQKCGLIYQNPRLSQEELNVSYPDDYEPFNSFQQDKSSGFIQWIKTRGIQKRIRTVLRYAPNGKLLDIGCAGGIFLQAMKNVPNWELYGVEPNKKAAESAGLGEGLNIFNGTLEQAAYPDNFFNAVTLWDVLEHLPDPGATLLEIQRILKPGGAIDLRLPNFNSLEARVFNRYWVGLDSPRHLYVFSKNNLKELLIKNGFKVVEIKSGIGSFPNFVLSLKFWLTAHKMSTSSRKKILSIIESLPIKALLSPFFFLIDQVGYGSSLVVVAVKAVSK